jgi:hypothetical protein
MEDFYSFLTANAQAGCESSARERRPAKSGGNMKKASTRKPADDLRAVLIEPDLAAFFPDAKSVNRALRLVAEAACAALPDRNR